MKMFRLICNFILFFFFCEKLWKKNQFFFITLWVNWAKEIINIIILFYDLNFFKKQKFTWWFNITIYVDENYVYALSVSIPKLDWFFLSFCYNLEWQNFSTVSKCTGNENQSLVELIHWQCFKDLFVFTVPLKQTYLLAIIVVFHQTDLTHYSLS